jgi:hypothetical protein
MSVSLHVQSQKLYKCIFGFGSVLEISFGIYQSSIKPTLPRAQITPFFFLFLKIGIM